MAAQHQAPMNRFLRFPSAAGSDSHKFSGFPRMSSSFFLTFSFCLRSCHHSSPCLFVQLHIHTHIHILLSFCLVPLFVRIWMQHMGTGGQIFALYSKLYSTTDIAHGRVQRYQNSLLWNYTIARSFFTIFEGRVGCVSPTQNDFDTKISSLDLNLNAGKSLLVNS